MRYLLIVTLLWAFSFSLIGEYLAGRVDSYFAVLTRIVIAGLLFVPLTRWRGHAPAFVRGMLLIGALQFGITYVCLYLSFSVLTVPEVLLFTILTPLHVTLIEDALNRRFNPWALLAALVAVLGAGIIRYDGISSGFLLGFLLLQVANFTFAAGQVLYKHLLLKHPSSEPQYKRFGFFYLGALLIASEFGAFKKTLDYKETGGAPILGVTRPVIKAHGSSDARAFKNAIRQAKSCVERDVSGAIEAGVARQKAAARENV